MPVGNAPEAEEKMIFGEAISDVTKNPAYRDPADRDPTVRMGPPVGHAIPRFRFFPASAIALPVAPDDRGAPFPIRMRAQSYIFLDVGRWLADVRDFGVIWGRHVYLCTYDIDGNQSVEPPNLRADGGLDVDFFRAMGGRVTIRSRATATWASEGNFDWEKLYVIVPDMHLLREDIGASFAEKRGWNRQPLQPEIDFLFFTKDLLAIAQLCGKLRVVQIGDSFDLWVGREDCLFKKNETHTIELVERGTWIKDGEVAQPRGGKWVWSYPTGTKEFATRDDLRSDGWKEVTEDPVKTLVRWVREVQGAFRPHHSDRNWVQDVIEDRIANKNLVWRCEPGERAKSCEEELSSNLGSDGTLWLNPVEKAFRLLEGAAGEGKLETVYIHGNHDDYLVLPQVCDAAGIPPRKPFYEGKRVLIEHGHRMEAYFPGLDLLPHNYDGDPSGFVATREYYQGTLTTELFGGLDAFVAEKRDQPDYYLELARVWLGRQAGPSGSPGPTAKTREPPHVCVIGHTHLPTLLYIK